MTRRLLLAFALLLVACGDDDSMCPDGGCLDGGDGGGDMRIEPLTCMNGMFDDGEADVDCGGDCAPCGAGSTCGADTDCTGRCSDGLCSSEQCADGSQNGDETDVDCGGSCPRCSTGMRCGEGPDCRFGVCSSVGLCLPPECVDGSLNGMETDIDCGGGVCDGCFAGLDCEDGTDCRSGVCDAGTCADARCDDGILNGLEVSIDCGGGVCPDCHCSNGTRDDNESDVDCGGDCPACVPGGLCDEDPDCDTFACNPFSGRCAPPTCLDGELSGGESSVDCGGPCNPCFEGLACVEGGDCLSRSCVDLVCVPASCDDGVENGDEDGLDCGGDCPRPCTCIDGVLGGDESDIDCGGTCAACVAGDSCGSSADCLSELCLSGSCRDESCANGTLDPGERDIDCGGDCARCSVGQDCVEDDECRSGRCVADSCAAAACDDGVQNGDESDVDCGGSCGDCADGDACANARDCTSGVCRTGACQAASCTDGVLNAGEEDVDCGGPCGSCFPASCDNDTLDVGEAGIDCGGDCAGCATGESCESGDDCASGRCIATSCAPPSCSDGAQSDAESDIDCGGPCAPCAPAAGCRRDDDCSSGLCTMAICRRGPTAAFTTSREGAAPLPVEVQTAARAGESPIASITYDFGSGFADDLQAVFSEAGYYTIRQRVRDEAGGVAEATLGVRVGEFDVRLDTRAATPRLRFTRDELTAIFDETFAFLEVQSTAAIEPESGVFYFEAQWLTPLRGADGIALVSADHRFGEPTGADDQSLSVSTTHSIFYDGMFIGGSVVNPSDRHIGVVVDYRGTTPIAHVIYSTEVPPIVVPLPTITSAVRFSIGGARAAVQESIRINPGNNRTAFPFHFDPIALTGLPITLGFGDSEAGPADAPPTLIGMAATTPLGTPVRLSATASDAEDGDLSHSIRWTNTAFTFADQTETVGPDFLFDPPSLGLHRVRARVYDASGQVAEAIIEVTVTGELPRFDTVQMVRDESTGDGVEISESGLDVHYTVIQKSGVRANQGVLEGFHYFEATRAGIITSQGAGLVTGFGDLNPYRQAEVPWSCSAQVLGGTWRNFVRIGNWDTDERTVGFAVDYRGDSPIVYYIVGGEVTEEIAMTEITVPIYPMLYGFPSEMEGPQWTVNFGETAFEQDPSAALMTFGVDPAGLALSWGR